jgi:hypothetical protein
MAELERIVQSAGLKIENAEYFSAYSPGRRNRKTSAVKHVGYTFTKIVSSLRDSLYILAAK